MHQPTVLKHAQLVEQGTITVLADEIVIIRAHHHQQWLLLERGDQGILP